ncbi:MAG: hypothetical protein C1941_03155 [Prosthecochloris sp.]|nr:hypothetical protein [Prosthecochloris sp.]
MSFLTVDVCVVTLFGLVWAVGKEFLLRFHRIRNVGNGAVISNENRCAEMSFFRQRALEVKVVLFL